MIEVALGYHTLDNYRALHDRVSELGTGVAEVVYRSAPPDWLLKMVNTVTEYDAAVVIVIKDVPPERTMAMIPFALYERLVKAHET